MRKRGGEDIGSVTHGAATFVNEFQFLEQNQNQLEWKMVHNINIAVEMERKEEQTLHS